MRNRSLQVLTKCFKHFQIHGLQTFPKIFNTSVTIHQNEIKDLLNKKKEYPYLSVLF